MAGIELGCKYFIQTPALASGYVTLNDPTDEYFIGYVTDITGLDMSGVRENAQVITAGDGGYHGPFWRDRRPWTMSGVIMPQFPLLSRDQAQENLERVVGYCVRSDGQLLWTPADGIEKSLNFRCQQPVRVTTGQSNVQKNFQIACVTADYRILGTTVNSMAAAFSSGTYDITASCSNVGNTDAPLQFVLIANSLTAPYVLNEASSKGIYFLDTFVITDDVITVDIGLNGSYFTATTSGGDDISGYIDPTRTDFSMAVISDSEIATSQPFRFGSSNFTTATDIGLTITWQDAWL